ncbi:GPI transamidase component PIG-T [Infundibulicybe gibba]|nr:GPI transamidase component PIG-T [Infundibulicybe gibba]
MKLWPRTSCCILLLIIPCLGRTQRRNSTKRFSFRTTLKGVAPRNPSSLGADDEALYSLSMALGQILREYAVTELHLTLNAGNWNYERWGYPDEAGVGSGAELWAWMGDGAYMSIDERWKGLRNALAGLFCASLGSMDELRTTSPSLSFQPEGMLPDWGLPHQIRHASLASEHVCTENLTPFLKLLPCKSLSGIAHLLNPHRLFDADWHGMGLHVQWHAKEGVQVRLTFQSVSDPQRISSQQTRDWSFQSLFDRTIDRNCPVARSSRAIVSSPAGTQYSITPSPGEVLDNNTAVLDVQTLPKPMNLEMRFHTPTNSAHSTGLPLSIHRTLKGSSQAHGKLLISITNHQFTPQSVTYLETLPWHVQLFLHSTQISLDGQPLNDAMSHVAYTPAVPHSRPTTFQSTLRVPAKSTIHLTIDVKKSFLRYTEHPPDAQRGWDLPPAIFTILNSQNTTSNPAPSSVRIYSPALLIDLATPDFSMPYNVIIFSCSLVAFLFGSVFNLLTRRFVIVRLDPGKDKVE